MAYIQLMEAELDIFATSPVIAQALRRVPRHHRAKKFGANNYVAEARLTHGPDTGNRKGAGPGLGNDNAAKLSLEWRRFLIHERELRRRVRELIAARRLSLATFVDGEFE